MLLRLFCADRWKSPVSSLEVDLAGHKQRLAGGDGKLDQLQKVSRRISWTGFSFV